LTIDGRRLGGTVNRHQKCFVDLRQPRDALARPAAELAAVARTVRPSTCTIRSLPAFSSWMMSLDASRGAR
jgi:hypothetical protein